VSIQTESAVVGTPSVVYITEMSTHLVNTGHSNSGMPNTELILKLQNGVFNNHYNHRVTVFNVNVSCLHCRL
jgi:hypothetical protein